MANQNSVSSPFISPFIRALAIQENIPMAELYSLAGSGHNGQIVKDDILNYLNQRIENRNSTITSTKKIQTRENIKMQDNPVDAQIPLSRIRKLIAERMVLSKQIAPHVSSFIEVNVTKLVNWRNTNKDKFQSKFGQYLTLTPFFVEAVAKGLKQFPQINATLQGDALLVKKQINIGIATALPDGNLIVPVIHQADTLNLLGIASSLNDLSTRARKGELSPEEIQGGTFTISNVGSFGNIGGTPIINQPELAILAVGAIVKKPVAVPVQDGYGVIVQDIVELWLSYDHRVIDGSLGGQFLKFVGDCLNDFDDSTVL